MVDFPEPMNIDIDSLMKVENILLSILGKREEVSSDPPQEGELNISVKTACCYIDKPYNIKKMCMKLEEKIKNYNTIGDDGLRKGKISAIKDVKYTKVDDEEDGILVKNSKANNNFYNSISIPVKIRQDKTINLMIFTNGRITCTGSKNDDDGLIAANILLDEMREMSEIFSNEEDSKTAQVTHYEVVMINSNFYIGFYIDNHKLFEILRTNRQKYDLFSSFDPTTYQGVKIYYMWNNNQILKNGVCICKKKCKASAKKKNGDGENDCRRISIAVFGTGKVLIAGAKNNEQLNDTYKFIVNLLKENYKNIVQFSIEDKKKLLMDIIDTKKGTVLKKIKFQ